MRFVPVIALFWLTAACASPPRATPNPLKSSDVLELAALPPGYETGQSLSESCRGRAGLRHIDDEALGDVDCSVERLSRALRARAAELSSFALVGKRCRTRSGEQFSVSCSGSSVVMKSSVGLGAAPAPASRLPAPSAAQVLDLDEPSPQQSAAIRVSFTPSAQAARLPARAYDRVAETRELAVGRKLLGQVSARCEACDELALRHALRVTAGRMGAGQVAAVRCFDDDSEQRCVAMALEPWSS